MVCVQAHVLYGFCGCFRPSAAENACLDWVGYVSRYVAGNVS